jgi:polyisoprenoid-binding protein YceI
LLTSNEVSRWVSDFVPTLISYNKKELLTMAIKRMLASLLVVLALVGTMRSAERFEIDPAHAFVTFSIAHFAGKARGSFRDVSGVILYDEKDITKSSVEVTIKTASIYTGNERRDTHLRSADFFEVEKYPEMTFKSRRIEKRTDGFVAVGDLTVKGVTKEVVMPFSLQGPVKDPLPAGGKRLLVATSFKVNRQDFGIKWSRVMEDGGLFVGNEVTLEIDVEAIVPKPRAE